MLSWLDDSTRGASVAMIRRWADLPSEHVAAARGVPAPVRAA
jgi:hypothetical protein